MDYVPSEEEMKQSMQRVGQLNLQITALNRQIEARDRTLLLELAELDETFDRMLATLRSSLAANKRRLVEDTQTETREMHLRLQEMMHRVGEEPSFKPVIQIVPPEILANIFECYLENEVPARRLALVCKRWRATMLETPRLWRTLEARCVHEGNLDFEHQLSQLKRRIELLGTGTMELNVTLYLTAFETVLPSIEPFRLVANTGIERWQSLRLACSTYHIELPTLFLAGIFVGSFKTLRVIEFSHGDWRNQFVPIEELLVKSRPPIDEIRITGRKFPQILRDSDFLRQAKKISCPTEIYEEMSNLENIQQLKTWTYIRNIRPYLTLRQLPPLPKITFFQWMSRSELYKFDKQKVEDLTIFSLGFESIYAYMPEIVLPVLTRLTIRSAGFYGLRNLIAPKLENLTITSDFDKRDLTVQTHTIKLRPLSLNFELYDGFFEVNTISVLRSWEQLQHIQFSNEWSAWATSFESQFFREKQLLPNLQTLRLDMKTKSDLENAKARRRCVLFAQKLLISRRGTSLETVEWRIDGEKDNKWYSIMSDHVSEEDGSTIIALDN